MDAVKERQFDVLTRGRTREQIKTLKDKTEFVVPNVRQLIAIEHRNIGVVQKVAT